HFWAVADLAEVEGAGRLALVEGVVHAARVVIEGDVQGGAAGQDAEGPEDGAEAILRLDVADVELQLARRAGGSAADDVLGCEPFVPAGQLFGAARGEDDGAAMAAEGEVDEQGAHAAAVLIALFGAAAVQAHQAE